MVFGIFSKRHRMSEEARRPLPTVKSDHKRVTKEIQADLWARINEFEDLPDGKQRQIFEAAVTMAQRGLDLHHLAKAMTDLGVSKSRAAYIARYLGMRSKALMDITRMRSMGLAEGKWLYSGAPCYSTKLPNTDDLAMDDAHRSANKKKFSLETGMKLNGQWCFPSLEPGCKCVAIAIVPGAEDG
jgi:hypothetical protein